MRENRLYGSEGGGTELNQSPLPLSMARSRVCQAGPTARSTSRVRKTATTSGSRTSLSVTRASRPECGHGHIYKRNGAREQQQKRPQVALLYKRDNRQDEYGEHYQEREGSDEPGTAR